MRLAPTLLLLLPGLSPAAQEEPASPNAAVLEHASEGARVAWQRLLRSEGSSAGGPIDAFHLRAEVRSRDGVRRNDLIAEYRFLNPHFIRFALPGKKGTTRRETGRGPGAGQKAYWLRDGEEVHVLQGRDYTEDRRLVDEMLVLSQNFLALSDLSRLSLSELGLSTPPRPETMPKSWALKRWWRKLTWLRLESADFALLDPERRTGGTGTGPHVAELGLDPGDGLPRIAIVHETRDTASRRTPARPMLFHLDHYRLRDGFLVPNQIHVHPLVLEDGAPRFSDEPAQEIDILEANLRPDFEPGTFRP